MNRAYKLFLYFALSCFLAASAGYFLLRMVMQDGWVFGALYRMFLYHWEHPLQYILVIAVIYGLIAAFMAIRFSDRPEISRWIIFSVMALTIVVASPIGGIMWVIHDMQAGYFTEGSRFWASIRWGTLEGIKLGWLVILLSIPYNVFGLIVGYFVTSYGFALARPAYSPRSSLQSLSAAGIHLNEKAK